MHISREEAKETVKVFEASGIKSFLILFITLVGRRVPGVVL